MRIFDPEVTSPENYRTRFPELKKYKEFEVLNARQLIWVWWFANPTSPLLKERDEKKRAEEAFKRSGYAPQKSVKEEMLRLKLSDNIAEAVVVMASIDPGARWRGKKIIESIFEEYERIIKNGKDGFTVKTKDEEGMVVETVDTQKFVNTSAKIAETVPILLSRLEDGFGVTLSEGEDDEDYGGFDDEYFKQK